MAKETWRLRVSGVVQGVGYRYFILHTANSLGLTGWVRNKRDGSVEAVIQGDSASVREMIRRAVRGPSMARVDNVDESPTDGDFFAFDVRDTD